MAIFLSCYPQEAQHISSFLVSVVIMPEDDKLLWNISEKISHMISSGQIKINSIEEATYFRGAYPHFEDLSNDGKIRARWLQIHGFLRDWSTTRVRIVRLEKVIEYLNYLMLSRDAKSENSMSRKENSVPEPAGRQLI